jgi:hypothetical protein
MSLCVVTVGQTAYLCVGDRHWTKSQREGTWGPDQYNTTLWETEQIINQPFHRKQRFHDPSAILLCAPTRNIFHRLVLWTTDCYFNRTEDVYSLENTDIPKAFFMPHHVCHCCTVIQGRCCTTVCSNNNLTSFLHECCNQNGGSTGVSRPGGQGRAEVAHGAKPLEQQSLGLCPNETSILGKGLGGKTPRGGVK